MEAVTVTGVFGLMGGGGGDMGGEKWRARFTNFISKSSPASTADLVTETRRGVAQARATPARGWLSVCSPVAPLGAPTQTPNKFRPP